MKNLKQAHGISGHFPVDLEVHREISARALLPLNYFIREDRAEEITPPT